MRVQAIIAYLVQVFLAWRINILLSKLWLMGVVILLATGQLGTSRSYPFQTTEVDTPNLSVAGIGATVWFEQIREFSRMYEIRPIATGSMVCGAVTDLVIAGVLVFYVVSSDCAI